jgi:hypothetical protein
MTTFVALYRGATVASAKLVAVSADPGIVADVAGRLLRQDTASEEPDPIVAPMEGARRRALRLIREEAGDAPGA